MLGLKMCKLQQLYELRCEENELLLIKEQAAEAEDALRLKALEDSAKANLGEHHSPRRTPAEDSAS